MSKFLSARHGATAIGFIAILLWSLLALCAALTRDLPPFQLLGLTFAIASIIFLIMIARQGEPGWRKLKQPVSVYAFGCAGLFGYHLFYFLAMQNAPTLEVSLIAYLWPVLIVLFSQILPGEILRWFHMVGAITCFGGVFLLLTQQGQGFDIRQEYIVGYLCAAACAMIWSSYSVLNRFLAHVPTEAVAGYCLLTALSAFIVHIGFENWVMPAPTQIYGILGLGIGPVGIAFFVWDYGTKKGDIKLLGILAYAAPLLSTLILWVSGESQMTIIRFMACLTIVGGCLIAVAPQIIAYLNYREK